MGFFICPGAQKAGTTLLYDLLKQHPEIGLANKKETKYFLEPLESISKNEYLHQFFSFESSSRVFGDIDPEYMYYPDVARKIYKTLGEDVKFIFLLRHPVERAYSHYWMSYQRGFELSDFQKATEEESDRLKGGDNKAIWHFSYLDRGFYSKQIAQFLTYFPKKNMHFILFEEFVQNKAVSLKSIFNFLEISDEAIHIETELRSNKGALPKSEILRKLHGQPSKLKKVLKILLPNRKLRWWIYPIVEKFNKSDKQYPKLEPAIKKKLMGTYYSDELIRLRAMTGLDIDRYWR